MTNGLLRDPQTDAERSETQRTPSWKQNYPQAVNFQEVTVLRVSESGREREEKSQKSQERLLFKMAKQKLKHTLFERNVKEISRS